MESPALTLAQPRWQDALEEFILGIISDDERGTFKPTLYRLSYGDVDYLTSRCNHRFLLQDITEVLVTMVEKKLIEASEFPCECCARVAGRSSLETVEHAKRFRLTPLGKEQLEAMDPSLRQVR